MSLERDALNVFDLRIYRPLRDGPAGDSDPADDVLLAGPLACVYEAENRVTKSGSTGEDIVITVTIFLDPLQPDGSPLPQLRERDLVQCTDPAGYVTQRMRVQNIGYWHNGGRLDHVELDI